METPIAKISWHEFTSPIVVPFAISKESLSQAKIVIVSITDQQGTVGIGEASPFPSLTHDTVADVSSVLNAEHAKFLNQTPSQALKTLGLRKSGWHGQSTTTAPALEMAMLDLFAKQSNCSLRSLFGSAALATLETDITLPLMPITQVGAFWQHFCTMGFRIIKVKVSGNVASDLELVRSVVACVGPDVALTLDGNQGYDLDNALKLVTDLARLDINPKFFEQPLPAHAWQDLAQLSAQCPIPICVDETVVTAADAKRVILEKTAQMINLKIMKSGVMEALQIAKIAQTAGIGLMIGGMLESEIAMSVSLHLASGFGGIAALDLDTPFFFKTHPTAASPWHQNSAVLRPALALGHGLSLA